MVALNRLSFYGKYIWKLTIMVFAIFLYGENSSRILHGKKYNSLYLCAFSLVIAYLMNLASIHIFKHIPYYLGNIPLGVSFMAISSFLQRYKQSAWILIVTIPLWLLNVFYFESFLDFRSNALLSGNYFMFYLSSVAGIISVNYLMRFIEFKKSFIFNAVLSYIGKNSLSFLFCIGL